MASNKRRGHLDKPTRNHLTGIEAALQAMYNAPRQEDEFTARELYEKISLIDKAATISSVLSKLNRMKETGSCTSRKTKANGRSTNLYRMTGADSAPHGG